MLALAKDITQDIATHPQESEIPELKAYMDYQRKVHSEKLVYHALDHCKTYLQKTIQDATGDEEKISEYIKKAFPFSSTFIDNSNTLMLMLRKLVNAHNSSNNWYRLNSFYWAVLYDCVERFVRIYNRLQSENPEKAAEYQVSDNVAIDFDDWVQLYFHDLDFLIGKTPNYLHYIFHKRNKAVRLAIDEAIQKETPRADAVKQAQSQYEIDDFSANIISGKKISPKEMELFYTSVENPIYEDIYNVASEEGMGDGESLVDHSFFVGHLVQGKSEQELARLMEEASQVGKN